MIRTIALLFLSAALFTAPAPDTHARPDTTGQNASSDTTLVVGSKKFTENVILGWMATQLWRSSGLAADHRAELGGSRFLWEALVRGDIDAYPEYTGTLVQEILSGTDVTRSTLEETLAEYGVSTTEPLGFNNTYAIGMRADHADSLSIQSISDLRRHPDLRLGFSNEFMDRGDGWPSLKAVYDLPHEARGIDHDLAYRGLRAGQIDVIDFYSTDAEIGAYDLRVLQDTRNHFPEYRALFLYRTELDEQAPEAVRELRRLEGRLPADTMQQLNKKAKIDGIPEQRVSARLLNDTFDLAETVTASTTTWVERLETRSVEHFILVGLSLGLAILLGIPLGIIAANVRIVGPGVLLLVGVMYTVPALALLAVMVPLVGLGRTPAVIALFLYSLLPIVWNTYTGLNDIARSLRESAEALGLTRMAQLFRVELPIAARSILAGIKIAAVINIGTATLGALIGAGGYGQPILTGIRRADLGLILEGTVPAAVLTILVLGALEATEHFMLPRGLR